MLQHAQRADLVERLACALGPDHMLGCDLLVSSFLASLQHSKRSCYCKPFPTKYFSLDRTARDGSPTKNYSKCLAAFSKLPNIQKLCQPQQLRDLSDDSLQALAWLLAGDIQLKPPMCCNQEVEVALNQKPSLRPHYIFEVTGPNTTRKPAENGHIIAFHGTSFSNLHSILHCGLLDMSQSTEVRRNGSVFGAGIYLSRFIEVAFFFSGAGFGWKKSLLGQHLRCLLMCQVAKDSVDTVECSKLKVAGLPPHYLLLKRADHVRVTHVLVYRQTAPTRWSFFGLDIGTWMVLFYLVCLLILGGKLNPYNREVKQWLSYFWFW